jgi:hypothetical protein
VTVTEQQTAKTVNKSMNRLMSIANPFVDGSLIADGSQSFA